jgi:hypothetical protein
MTAVAETVNKVTVALPARANRAALTRQVVVAVDACCELAPHDAAAWGVHIIPRTVHIDGRPHVLNQDQTLHHRCWTKEPRQLHPALHTLDEIASTYEQILDQGQDVLALHPLATMEGSVRTARAARSILLAGQFNAGGRQPRVAVCEVGAISAGFTFLVALAARGASESLTLQQLTTLLDHAQSMLHCYYLTRKGMPTVTMPYYQRSANISWLGNQYLWEIDRGQGGLVCRARGLNLVKNLFQVDGLLSTAEPTTIRSTDPRLFDRINQARKQANLPLLQVEPGGLGLAPLFPRGCVELTVLPAESVIDQLIEVIQRIEQPEQNRQSSHWGGL